MTLWLILSALTFAVLAALLIPMLRRPIAGVERLGYDLAVYRDQLVELDRDGERGLMSAEQIAASRTEISRRMLGAEIADAPSAARRSVTATRWLRLIGAMTVLVVLPLGSLGLYSRLGAPGLPDQPFAARQNSPEFQMTAQAAKLSAQLAQTPDATGFVLLGQTLQSLRRPAEAVQAFRRAIALGSTDSEVYASLGEALVMADQGGVGPDARAAFFQVLRSEPGDPRARFYLGLSEEQIGKFAEAIAIWRDLQKDTPEDAPWRDMLAAQVAQAAAQGKLDPATIVPAAPKVEGAPPPAPSGQEDMIRQMVAKLAAKMETTPDDVEGWIRLARSYRVLNDLPKARAAAAKAIALQPKAVPPKLELANIELAAAPGDDLPADFVATMREILALDANNRAALYYLGTNEARAGHAEAARTLWTKLLGQLPADDASDRADLAKKLDGLKK
jgi:cytochrome c-type biogenesis protein CcmH